MMFLKDSYSERRLQNLFHKQVLGVVDFETLHERVMAAVKRAKVIDAKFSISYKIRESDVAGEGWMSYRINLTGKAGFLFKRPVSAGVQFESVCRYEEPVQVEASTEIKQDRDVVDVTTLYHTYIGQGRGRRLIPGTDYLA